MATTRPQRNPWRAFLLNLSLVVVLAISALFAGLALSGQRAIEAELKARAKAIFDAVVLARAWNSLHGGVFVVKRPGMESNPYLPNPDRQGADGTIYTLKNPALMAREISELAERQGSFHFRITSLKPLNPANAADPFEAQALASFEGGTTETLGREVRQGSTWYRYMAPLRIEASCLECHGREGYRVGEIRGGISVSFNVDAAEQAIFRTRWLAAVFFAVFSLLLVVLIRRLVAKLHRRLDEAEAQIRELASTDELTGLANRRAARERLEEELGRSQRYGRPFGCALLDIDDFKAVNDRHGHDAGDAVLRAVSRTVRAQLRLTDVVGRWGGEEFLIVLPEADAAQARFTAERLRRAVGALRIEHGGATLAVTVSLGVAATSKVGEEPGPASAEELVKRADDALYRAKASGRDRVEGEATW